MAKIGFIGLGHMGLPMAMNLIKAGHVVTGFDLQKEPLEQLSKAGGSIANSIAQAASNQELVITMLQTGEQVLQVFSGPEGIMQHAQAQTLYVDCSTIDVATARKVHSLAESKSILALDAPVSGGVTSAVAGTLTFIVGGDEATFNKAQPILSLMGTKIIHAGGPGLGDAAKICNNMILGISMIGISESFILARELGLSDQKLFEIVTNASGQCWSMSKYVPVPGILENVPANNDYKPGFAAAMMLKDLHLGDEEAKSAQVQLPLSTKSTELYQHFIDQGHGNLDFSAIINFLNQQSEV